VPEPDKTAQRLEKIARLHRGTTSPGERTAAAAAFGRVSRGTKFANVSISGFRLRSCGCATTPCRHWAARRKPPPPTPEQEAAKKACREALDLVRSALDWDKLGPLYARTIEERFRPSSQLRLSESEVKFLKELASQITACCRALTNFESACLNGIENKIRKFEATRQEWAAKRARKLAAAAHARSFIRKRRSALV
jgi:hypothetical protein